ncbi:hypothetical protein J5J83_19820 [Azoarcus sp. L1K30]|uniref:hypothetical protein n=1 Tax=Azoarcus sp. L1K30 TaxID=2820277 RepID=UPI001B8273EE|nr:hypothetical protein [Azoarcus sp. L1K30]MBR0568376.1 hypothetical protein [Azoarcus sp. L1K30]
MKGYRVGEAHPRALLTEAEIDQMVEDRGPDNAPRMSYSMLAARYRVSKSCVRDILNGNRRGRVCGEKRYVKLEIEVSLPTRAKILRRGGSKWLEQVVAEAFRASSGEMEKEA